MALPRPAEFKEKSPAKLNGVLAAAIQLKLSKIEEKAILDVTENITDMISYFVNIGIPSEDIEAFIIQADPIKLASFAMNLEGLKYTAVFSAQTAMKAILLKHPEHMNALLTGINLLFAKNILMVENIECLNQNPAYAEEIVSGLCDLHANQLLTDESRRFCAEYPAELKDIMDILSELNLPLEENKAFLRKLMDYRDFLEEIVSEFWADALPKDSEITLVDMLNQILVRVGVDVSKQKETFCLGKLNPNNLFFHSAMADPSLMREIFDFLPKEARNDCSMTSVDDDLPVEPPAAKKSKTH